MLTKQEAGSKVRLKSNPEKVGVLTGRFETIKEKKRFEVIFGHDGGFYPEMGLENIPERESEFDLVKNGRFGSNSDLRRSLTYHRLSGKLANLIYSLNTTNTDFYAYQFKPVLNFLDSPCNGLLIADEVGLGKTIEAGLIWTEIRSRYDAKRLLIVCPAMLREKWKRELLERFQVDAQIVSAEGMIDTIKSYQSGSKSEFCMIASLQGLRPPRDWDDPADTKPAPRALLARLLRENEHDDPLFDMVIIDEAHYLRNQETKSAEIARLLRRTSDNLLLLSATPIQLKSADLFQLLHLIDEDTFSHEYMFESILSANTPLVKLRDLLLSSQISVETYKEHLEKAKDHPLFSGSLQLKALLESPISVDELATPSVRADLADKIDRVMPLSKVVSRTRKRDVLERRVLRRPFAYMAEMSSVETDFYARVTDKVREYCSDRDISEGLFLTIPQRQMCSSMAAACKAWQHKAEAREDIEEILWELSGQEGSDRHTDTKPLMQELSQIAKQEGDYVALKKNDSKYAEFLKNIKIYWTENPGAKIVLFSYFRGTLHYLYERLSEDGIESILLMGGIDKEEALATFAERTGPNILLSSEVASEGVDLQFSSLLINYDLPWNPMKIEQRIGRIDRIGQKSPVINIWNIFCKDTLDERVYVRLFNRLRIFEEALGTIEVILGDEISKMSYGLLSHTLSTEEENAIIEQTSLALERNFNQQNELEEKAVNLIAHGQYIQEKVESAKDTHRHISHFDLMVYFKDFFSKKYPGCEIIQKNAEDLLFDIHLSSDARVDLNRFIDEKNLHGKTQLSQIDTTRRRAFLFENKLKRAPAGVEIISQYHPVIRFISEGLLKEDDLRPYPITAVSIDKDSGPESLEPGIYVFAVQKWLFTGARDVECLAFKAQKINEPQSFLPEGIAEQLITIAALHGKHWLSPSEMIGHDGALKPFQNCIDGLDSDFERRRFALDLENKDRIDFQLRVLDQHEQNQRKKIELRISNLKNSGKIKTIPAEEGKLRKLEGRVADKRNSLVRKQHVTAEAAFVTGGAILIR